MYTRNVIYIIATVIFAGAFSTVLDTVPLSEAKGRKKCYDCHKDEKQKYSSYKYLHDPVKQEDCEGCHKRHGFAQQLTLTDYTSELCYSCHAESREDHAIGSQHFPVSEGVCWDCHDPHGSDKPNYMREGPEGANDPASCLICHKVDLAAAIDGAHSHEPFKKQDCLGCHTAHSSENDGLLVKPADDLCADCHKSTENAFLGAHEGRNIEALSCVDCHTGHSANTPGLLSVRSHAPFADGDCETCHSEPDSAGAVVFESTNPYEICADCHDEQVEKTSLAHAHEAVSGDNCGDCHNPHSSRHKSLLLEPADKLCGECHSDVLSGGEMTPHVPVALGQCADCHEAHGSEEPGLLKLADAELCLSCHSEFAEKADSSLSKHEATADCLACHNPHEANNRNLLKANSDDLCLQCHEVDESALAAESAHQPYLTGGCINCHSPHHSDNESLVRTTDPSLCLGCHTDVEKRVNMPVGHSPAQDDCLECHSPHYSEHKSLLTEAPNQLCESCHDTEEIGTNASHAHAPAANGDCTGCHNPHGAIQDNLITGRARLVIVDSLPVLRTPRLSEKRGDLCYTCHEELVEPFRTPGTHQPVLDGDCDACHTSHGSEFEAHTLANAPELCMNCHESDESLSESHSGFNVSTADCLNCHNPHTSVNENLIRTNLHSPFEEKSCEDCHEKELDGSATIVSSQDELCGECHDIVAETQLLEHQHGPFAVGDCSACHRVHAADHESLLRSGPEELCLSCHDDLTPMGGTDHAHQPFAAGLCLDCHQPHGSANEALKTESEERLCLGCHIELAEVIKEGRTHEPVVDGSCTACHEPHTSGLESLLSAPREKLCGDCHEFSDSTFTESHYTFDVSESYCQNCHEPHASHKNVRGLLLPKAHKPFKKGKCESCHVGTNSDQLKAPVRDLCLGCHGNFEKELQRAFVHAPTSEEDGCIACHGPHVGHGESLQILKGAKTCLQCHNNKEFTGANIHEAAEDCSNCHVPHSGDYKNLLETPDILELCGNCHDDADETHFHPMGADVINPLTRTELNCLGCHSPHSSDHPTLLVEDPNRGLCVVCHDTSH